MANEIKADITIHGADKASRDLRQVGDSADKACDQIEDLGKDAKVTGAEVDGLTKKTRTSSESLSDMARDAGFLDREVTRLKGSISSLTRELNKTGDTSLLKDIRREKRQLSTFSKLAADVAAPAVKAGESFGIKFVEAAGQGIKAGGPFMAVAFAALAAASTPYLGAMVSAAVIGGTGAGGLVGGLMLAAQDPRVKAGGEAFAANALGDLQRNIGTSFVEPAIAALGTLGGTISEISQQAAPAFAKLATEIKPLADGLAGMARNAMPGFLKAIEAAGPVLRTISMHLPKIGESVGHAFEEIATGGDGAVQALDLTLTKVERLIEATGELIGWLGRSYDTVARWGAAYTGAAEDVFAVLGELGPAWSFLADIAAQANDDLEDSATRLKQVKEPGEEVKRTLFGIAEGAEKAAEESAALDDAISSLFGQFMSADEAALRVQEGMRELREELGENEKTLKNNTAAGDENRLMILGQVDAYERQREANAKTSMGLEGANRLYEEQVGQLRSVLVQMGFNAAAVDTLIGKYRAIPTTVTTKLFVDDAQAWSRIRAIERRAAEAGNPTINPFQGRAHGGPTVAGRTYLVGENGPELWSETSNGHVTNAAQTRAMMSGASGGAAWSGGGGGGGGMVAVVSVRQSTDQVMSAIAAAIVPYLQVEVINRGGIVQDTLGRPPR